MSLRVLLADESPSIKKAFSIALQDYGVKIQTVHNSIDVQEIYQNFQPDICFMDVLLPKLNGYDVCEKLKTDKASSQTPIVLMWSGFMELDKIKFKSCKADESIEKPFETVTLRTIVKKLVSKLNQNELSNHLIIDTPLEIKHKEEPLNLKNNDNTPVNVLNPLNLDDNDNLPPIPNFESILKEDTNISSSKFNTPQGFDSNNLKPEDPESEDDWQSIKNDDLTPPEGLDDVDSFSVHAFDNDSLPFEPSKKPQHTTPKKNHSLVKPLSQENTNEVVPLKPENENATSTITSQLSKEELKRLILAQSNDIIESIVWDVVPELAKEMIQKEIQRLTGKIKYEDDLR